MDCEMCGKSSKLFKTKIEGWVIIPLKGECS